MLRNYYNVSEDMSVERFLRGLKEKKISHYIILDDGEHYVDMRNLALHFKSPKEKIRNYKVKISQSKAFKEIDKLRDLYLSGSRLIKVNGEIFDFMDGLKVILDEDFEFINKKISELGQKEVIAITENDKISTTRRLFLEYGINLLPVIDENTVVVGEVRPFDFLVSDFFNTDEGMNFFDKNKRSSVMSLPVKNIMNNRPLLVDKNAKVKEAINLMIEKKLPSLIVVEGELLYSVISYTDIFKEIDAVLNVPSFNIEYINSKDIFPDELDIIRNFAERTMRKVIKVSDYDTLRLSFKVLGNKKNTQRLKVIIKGQLISGKRTISIEKELAEREGDKERWNVPLLAQELLNALERKVIAESRKNR